MKPLIIVVSAACFSTDCVENLIERLDKGVVDELTSQVDACRQLVFAESLGCGPERHVGLSGR